MRSTFLMQHATLAARSETPTRAARSEDDVFAPQLIASIVRVFADHPFPPQWEQKPDGSVVTEHDHTVNQLILEQIKAKRPRDPIISEESHPHFEPTHSPHSRCWIVDPIDGTKTMLAGGTVFGSHFCLVVRGRVIRSLVIAPRLSHGNAPQTVWELKGGTVSINGHGYDPLLSNMFNDQPAARRVILSRHLLPQQLTHMLAFPAIDFEISTRSTLVRCAQLCSPVDHQVPPFSAVVLNEPQVWDVVGGAAMVAATGGAVWGSAGNVLDLSTWFHWDRTRYPGTIILGNPVLVRQLAAHLGQIP